MKMTVSWDTEPCSLLLMEVARIPETSVNFYQTTRFNISENSHHGTSSLQLICNDLKNSVQCAFLYMFRQITVRSANVHLTQTLCNDKTTERLHSL
jgi:hypothetical protein